MSFVVIGDDVYIPYLASAKNLMYKRFRLYSIISQEEMSTIMFGKSKSSECDTNNLPQFSSEATSPIDINPKKRKLNSDDQVNNSINNMSIITNEDSNLSISSSDCPLSESPSTSIDLLNQQQVFQTNQNQNVQSCVLPLTQQTFPAISQLPLVNNGNNDNNAMSELPMMKHKLSASPKKQNQQQNSPNSSNKQKPILPLQPLQLQHLAKSIPVKPETSQLPNYSQSPKLSENQQQIVLSETCKIIDPSQASIDVLLIVSSGRQFRLNFKVINEVPHFLRFINGVEYCFDCNKSTQLLEYSIKDLDNLTQNLVKCMSCKKKFLLYDTFKVDNNNNTDGNSSDEKYICIKCCIDDYNYSGSLKDPFNIKKEKGGLFTAGVFAYCSNGTNHFKPLSHFLNLEKGIYKFCMVCKYCRLKKEYIRQRRIHDNR